MSNIRIDPISAVVRVYENPIDPSMKIEEMKEQYYKTFFLTFSDDGSVRVQGTLLGPTLSELKQLINKLKEMGYSSVSWRHKDKEINKKL